MIKILLGGSPCTFWSIAQKNGRETEASGMGWELFKNYLVAKEKFKPDFFLYENNKSAAQPIKDQIAKELGVDLMYINSALVSAQNRQRFYAFNWEVEQPEDRGIVLRDILESGDDLTANEKSYCLTARYGGACPWNTIERSQRTMVIEPVNPSADGDKARTLKAQYYKNGIANFVTNGGFGATAVAEPVRIPEYGVEDKSRPVTASYAYKGSGEGSLVSEAFPDNPNKQVRDYVAEPINLDIIHSLDSKENYIQYDLSGKQHNSQDQRAYYCDSKHGTLNASSTQSKTGVVEPIRIGDIGSNSQAHRVYSCDGKSVTLSANGGGQGGKTGLYACPSTDGKPIYEVKDGFITIKDKQYPIKLADGYYIIRKLTPIECERLQTLPDNYTAAVSNSQRYKGLGNGWTAEVIIHILNGVLKDVPRDEEIVVLSMYDGIGTGRYCLDKMGFTNVRYYAYEIDKYAKQVAMSNYPDIIQMGDAFNLRHPDWTIGY